MSAVSSEEINYYYIYSKPKYGKAKIHKNCLEYVSTTIGKHSDTIKYLCYDINSIASNNAKIKINIVPKSTESNDIETKNESSESYTKTKINKSKKNKGLISSIGEILFGNSDSSDDDSESNYSKSSYSFSNTSR